MKKTILFASAALAALSFTSCSNEVDPFESLNEERATIDLNITNDDEMLTRAEADLSQWEMKMDNGAWAKANTFVDKTYTAKAYTFTVGNYQTAALAMPDGQAGNPYYTLTEDVTLSKGANSLIFECGKAKNSKVSVDWSETSGAIGLTMTSVLVEQVANNESDPTTPARSYTFTSKGDAYFYAGAAITCTISYTYNDVPKTITRNVPAPAPGTQYAFNISATNDGKITTLTITYDGWVDGQIPAITINALDGSEVQ